MTAKTEAKALAEAPKTPHGTTLAINAAKAEFCPQSAAIQACQNTKSRGDARDGYIRFRGGRRRLRRLHGGGTAFGRSEDVGGAAGCRRQERQLGGHDAVCAGADGRRQREQLGLQHRAAKGPERPHRLSAARQGTRRFIGDQCDGLYPRPPLRLRSMGFARQCRLVVRGRAALLQARGKQRRFRGRISRQGRPARRQQAAHGKSSAANLPSGGAGSPVSPARGFQRRRA